MKNKIYSGSKGRFLSTAVSWVILAILIYSLTWDEGKKNEHSIPNRIEKKTNDLAFKIEQSTELVSMQPLSAIVNEKNTLSKLHYGAVKNVATLIQFALISNNPDIKSKAVSSINYCKNFTKELENTREAVKRINGDWSKISQYYEISRAECQTLSASDMVWVKQLATDAYKLGSEDGAYLYATEAGIPDNAEERKAWLQSLKAAAYNGHAMSQLFVGKKMEDFFEDREEYFGFRMASLRASEQLASLPDHMLYPIVSLNLIYDENSASVRRAVDVMKRLREAQEKRARLTALGR